MSEYIIKKIGAADFNLLIPLMQNCFGMEVDIDYFRWKYIDNPAGEFLGFVAVDTKGEVGAYYGVIPELYIIQGEEKKIYQSCDTMTHSSHRRRGLFQMLAKHCYDYLAERKELFVIGFGGGQSTPGFLKFGWKHIFDIHYYFYLRRFYAVLKIFSPPQKLLSQVVPVQNINEIEDLIKESNKGIDVASKKGMDLFQWRISNPLHKYQVFGLKDGGSGLLGFVVFYESANDYFLFDLYAKTLKGEKLLLAKLKKLMYDNKKRSIISFAQKNSPFSRKLSRNNFMRNYFKKGPLSTVTPFIIYADDQTMERMAQSRWNVTPYEHDSL